MNELEQKFLAHSAKGHAWKQHKYIAIENGRYIYPEDLSKHPNARKITVYGSDDYYKQTGKSGKTLNNKKANTSTSTKTQSTTSSVNKTNQTAAQIANKNSSKDDDIDSKIKKAIEDYEAEKKKEEEAKKKEKEAKKSTSTKKKTSSKLSKEASNLNLSEEDLALLTSNIDTNATNRADVINSLALKVIRGDFGNGQERKDKLGQFYVEIQSRVNELIKTMSPKRAKAVRSANRTASKSKTKAKNKTVVYGSAEYEKQKKGTTINNRKTFKHSDDEFLLHFGTKKRSGRYKYGSGDRPYQHDPKARKKYKNYKYKERKRMSDEELESAISRARKEAELVRLQNETKSRGEKFIGDLMYDVGKRTISTALSGALIYKVASLAAGEFDSAALGNAILTGGGGSSKFETRVDKKRRKSKNKKNQDKDNKDKKDTPKDDNGENKTDERKKGGKK